MIDFDWAREQLNNRLAVKQERREAAIAEAAGTDCEHEWERYRETLRSDNPGFGGTAYYRVLGCGSGRSKRRMELVVER